MLRTKSFPVPRGSTASSTPSAPTAPFTTSCTVPSPPTMTSSVAPSAIAFRVSSVSSPGRCERSASPLMPAAAARRAISGQR
jgi:hypothetical protein